MADGASWQNAGAMIAAIGALGVAAYGLTESIGKALAYCHRTRNGHVRYFGLPYVGLNDVEMMIRPLKPALQVAYGDVYLEIIAKQYRAGGAQGRAPDTIRNGVRLGLPFLGKARASALIAAVWHMDKTHSDALAEALQAFSTRPPPPPWDGMPGPVDPAQALAGRFAAALDARVNAAFAPAAERYENTAKTFAGVVAILLAVAFNWLPQAGDLFHSRFPWSFALLVGVLAVPLAPIANDVATSLQNAAAALKTVASKRT